MHEPSPLLPPGAEAEARRAAVYLVMAQIPPGKVISYGELAAIAGLGRAARWVGRLMAQLPDDTRLPWHRVIAAGHQSLLPKHHTEVSPQAQTVGHEACTAQLTAHRASTLQADRCTPA